MIKNAEEWASNYLQRFDAMVAHLQSHELMDKVVYIKFDGLSEEEIAKAEENIHQKLNETAEDYELDTYPFEEKFVFDEYMRAFYQQTNGLHLSWNTHIYPTMITESKQISRGIHQDLVIANDSHYACEGWVSLLALDKLLDYHRHYPLADGPEDSSLGEDIQATGGCLIYFDFFNYYHDTALELRKEKPLRLFFGEDHSACYPEGVSCDFVTYMEFVLFTYGSVLMRSRGLRMRQLAALEEYRGRKTGYEQIFKWAKLKPYTSLAALLKYHFEENGYDHATIENFQTKAPEIYHKIEQLLNIKIEKEFES